MVAEEFTVRAFKPEDKAFVINSWLKSYKNQSPFTVEISEDIYYKFHPGIVERILTRHTTKVLIACPKTEDEVIVGYLVFEQIPKFDIFHYIYVKRAFNGFGVANLLFGAAPFKTDKKAFASHSTKCGRRVMDRSGLIYNPYLMET